MSLNNLNHFVMNPISLDISRSRFRRPFTHKTTFKSGDLVPFYCDEVLPGDTFEISWSSVIRMLTPAVPVMDNAFFDMYFFFVPFRLCTWGKNDWQKVQGENVGGYWAPSSESTLVSTSNATTLSGKTITAGSVANYLGLPIGGPYSSNYGSVPINLMPFQAYIAIWNEWFRDQNTQAPEGFVSVSYNGPNYYQNCLKVNKLHDYFTSSLPAPQKGASVLLPMGTAAPVKASISDVVTSAGNSVRLRKVSDNSVVTGDHYVVAMPGAGSSDPSALGVGSTTPSAGTESSVYFSNLYADLATATASTVNELRQAFAIQRLLEKDARGGSRYREILKAHFGVTIPDLTIQVPEYLGGKRIPLNITQVLQTSETSGTSPLGATGAFSNTSISDKAFIKSFNEYGYIMGVGCVRTEQSYSQGIPRYFTKNRRYDFYLPALANIGEQPIYTRELYAPTSVSATYGSTIFGYQEAWADYRFHPSLVTGALAPNANDATMTAWTYTNKFTAAPVLNSDFMKQPTSQIGDTLVVTNTANQFVADFYFNVTCTRPMPLYSIPGLIDHH